MYGKGEDILEPGQGSVMRKLKQKLIIPLTEKEMLARQILVEYACKFLEEKE